MGELTPQERQGVNEIRALIERATPKIAEVLPKHLTPERLTRTVLACVSRTPILAKCTPLSVLQSVMIAGSLGLEADGGPLGRAYLVPFYNHKIKGFEAQLVVGYRGLIELATRSGQVSRVIARAVYEGDDFDYCYGTDEYIRHKPGSPDERGDLTHTYAIAYLRDGGEQFVVLQRPDIEAAKAKSNSRNRDKQIVGPWVDHYDAMAVKTAVRQLAKWIPLSPDVRVAVTAEEEGYAAARESADERIRRMLPAIEQPTLPAADSDPIRSMVAASNGSTDVPADDADATATPPADDADDDDDPAVYAAARDRCESALQNAVRLGVFASDEAAEAWVVDEFGWPARELNAEGLNEVATAAEAKVAEANR